MERNHRAFATEDRFGPQRMKSAESDGQLVEGQETCHAIETEQLGRKHRHGAVTSLEKTVIARIEHFLGHRWR